MWTSAAQETPPLKRTPLHKTYFAYLSPKQHSTHNRGLNMDLLILWWLSSRNYDIQRSEKTGQV